MVEVLRQFNWLDFIILIVIIFYSLEGYSAGFVGSVLDLVSFVASFIIGLKTYTYIALLLLHFLTLPPGIAKAIGFLAGALITQVFLNILFGVVKNIFFGRLNKISSISKLDKVLGIIPGIFSSVVLLAFLLTLLVALPLSPFIRNSLSSSKLGSLITTQTQGFEKSLNSVFGKAVNETINFLTVEPQENQLIKFNFKTNKFAIDLNSEQQMFIMVNSEREARGIKPLVFASKLKDVAINHCEDMLQRGYFSHYTPEGLSPFDRMAQVDISYIYAGENLAFSQNVNLAMQGLMQSPGHRENILSPNFGKIGIGVIDGGIYGEIFCQEFTD